MRPSMIYLCVASAGPWVSEGLARTGGLPAADTASAHPHNSTAAFTAQQEDRVDIEENELAVLQKRFREARKQILRALHVEPFSYANVVARARGLSRRNLEDPFDLRGLCSTDYDICDESCMLEAATSHSASCIRDANAPHLESSAVTAVPADAGCAVTAKKLFSTVPPVAVAAGSPTASVVGWPTVLQMTKAIERRIMDYQHLWRAASVLASDRPGPGEAHRASASPTGTVPPLCTSFLTGVSLPFSLATIPHTLLSAVAENAILHSWYGGPHGYPGGSLPCFTSAFAIHDSPLLRVDDVKSLQWDRAQAANFLVSVLRQPALQKELRLRLWGAAQNYHRGILRKLESLALTKEVEGRSKGASDDRRIVLDQEPGTPSPVSLSLREVREDLFSFDEVLYFARVSPSSYSNSRLHRVECQSLRATHLFRFASSHANVAAALSDRPRSNVSSSLFRVSLPSGDTSGKETSAPLLLSTRDKLWLLLSDMVRLRYLVAYLLNFEVLLHRVRNNNGSSQHTQPNPKEAYRASFHGSSGLAEADAQDAEDAKCIAAVFHFLEIRLHKRLAGSVHDHRFLRLARVRHCERSGTPELRERESGIHDTTNADMSFTHEPRRYATAQELFTAFSKELNGATTAPSAQPAPVASCTASTQGTRGGQAAPENRREAMRSMADEMHSRSGPPNGARDVSSSAESSPLSDTDADFLKAVLAMGHQDSPLDSTMHGGNMRGTHGGSMTSPSAKPCGVSCNRGPPGR
ncbi:hypothetical protein, conserved [Leishmania tarentolae]|uniref:Uncharacterized protein n=1 Tax=Leishmania tarentolae TaxID=5689 RepID=A0A640KPU4_LEITA|nr:hypothetical protein, conserved [Leishmania tarentolae]